MRKIIILISIFLSIKKITYAQESNVIPPSIKVLSRVDSNSIMLRWAVTNSSAWVKANKYGYSIERFTVKRDGLQLDKPKKTLLTPTPITPKPLAEWENIVKNNNHAAILAQALYGETFEIENSPGGLAMIINKAKEIEQRFSFALFAADMNYEAAKMGGLGFVDNTIKKNETYFYAIKTAIPEELLKVEMGTIFVESNKEEELPKPIDLIAIGDDKSILLTWEYEMFKTIYTSYFIERSEDGNNFTRLGDTPLVNMNDKPDNPAKRMFHIDPISKNDKKYYYRVKGISSFGIEGPYSDVVVGTGIKKLVDAPHISKYEFDNSGTVKLFWEFNKTAEKEISSFTLNWSAQEKGPYKIVRSDIASHTREITYAETEPSNYFTITAIGNNNQKKTSFPKFIQTIDSIPPTAPIEVAGIIDTLGVVKLKWKANTENDLLGYRIFRGNIEKEEVAQLTIAPIIKNTFQDTVQIKSLNTKVYYQIVAVDKRFNMSDFSEKLQLKKPDIIPPSSPIFSKYKVIEKGIDLQWINSSSDDVVYHKLYRQHTTETEKGWEMIYKTDTISNYTDKTAKNGKQYRYAIFAEDESALISLPSTPLTITVQKNSEKKIIKGFSGFANRIDHKIELSWNIVADEVSEISIYKNKQGGKPVLWKQFPPTIKKIKDTHISPNTNYTYQLKAKIKNGSYTTIKTVNITY